MKTDIKTMMKMNVGDIKKLENMRNNFYKECGDIIDRQRETVASYIEQEDINELWADEFIRGF